MKESQSMREAPPPSLRQRLEAATPSTHEAIVDQHEAAASSAELIDLVARPPVPLAPFVPRQLTIILKDRGSAALDDIAETLLRDPLAPIAQELGGVLADMVRAKPQLGPRIAALLIRALDEALERGGNTRAVFGLTGGLMDCLFVAGSLPEAVPVAQRLLARGAEEGDPYLPVLHTAQALARGLSPPPAKP